MVPYGYREIILYLISGTPVHNGLKDMYPLFRFLEMPVFSVFSEFRSKILKGDQRTGALRMQVLLRAYMLRRRKEDTINGKPIIVLPEKVLIVKSLLILDYRQDLY